MNTKQWIITIVATTLTTFTYTAAAECEDDEGNFVKTGYLQQASNDRHQGPDNSGRDRGRNIDANHGNENNRDNENSNRQSDPDSTRGLARAEERRGEKGDDRHDSRSDRPWYNPFGWRYPFSWFD